MTTEKIAEVKTWLERLKLHLERSVRLSERMSLAEMTESNDLFWALAKYAENVEESVIKLDDLNKDIYPALVELDEGTWQGLKGMRSRLAHAFWNIDPQILWSTITRDFPALLALVSTMIVTDHPISDDQEFQVYLETERLLGLPDVSPGSIVQAGRSIVVMVFWHNSRVGVFRIGHEGSNKLVTNSNFDLRFSLFGRPHSPVRHPGGPLLPFQNA